MILKPKAVTDLNAVVDADMTRTLMYGKKSQSTCTIANGGNI